MENQPFDLKVEAEDGRLRIVLAGELDLHTSPRLAGSVLHACSNGTEEVEIDMREVRFIDSTGLRTLLVAADDAASHGVALHVIPSRSEHVTNVFEVTRLLDQLSWRDGAPD
jgi:anti-anti-sigma factor